LRRQNLPCFWIDPIGKGVNNFFRFEWGHRLEPPNEPNV
jgi:hypothetical protein